jgi:hypothetical protein
MALKPLCTYLICSAHDIQSFRKLNEKHDAIFKLCERLYTVMLICNLSLYSLEELDNIARKVFK